MKKKSSFPLVENISRIWARTAVAASSVAVVALAISIAPQEAQAVPSFARQTGQPCGACHTDFPQLTPFGRSFKLGGYTLGGGRSSDTYKKTFGGENWIPPISAMAVAGFTQTKASQPADAMTPYNPNNNLVLQTGSLFYAGAITENIGAFMQVTLDAAAPGGGSPQAHWDNFDIRYANTGSLAGMNVVYGLTVHNNPTVQDVWNSVPAWAFPFMSSNLAPTPDAKTLIDGAFAQRVVGTGVYTYINDLLYLEFSAYQDLNPNQQKHLGVDPADVLGRMNGLSPYARVAVEPKWGNHSLMIGAFGLMTRINPWANPGVDWSTFDQTNKYTDLGADAQYQYMGDKYSVTLRTSYIYEKQQYDPSFIGTFADNLSNNLSTFKAQASLIYPLDTNKFVFTGGYFKTTGSADATLYSGNSTFKPDSDGWIGEIAYVPFGMDKSPLWPYYNARIGLQYTFYNKFNGASTNYDNNGTNARDNNTLYLYWWAAM